MFIPNMKLKIVKVGTPLLPLPWTQRASTYRINKETRNFIRESLRFFKEKKRESSTYGIAFQAKFLYHWHFFPRLRHGLLSLCSVASFRRKKIEISVINRTRLIIVLVYSSHCRGEGHLTTLYYIAKFLKRRMHSPSHYELWITNYELFTHSSFPSFTYSIARLI